MNEAPNTVGENRHHFLEIRGLTKHFQSGERKLKVLDSFDLDLAAGEFLAIAGPSGSGKTTLLNLIAGLDRPDGGRISLAGRDLTALNDKEWDKVRQSDIGFVFQFNQLLPEFTALENVMLPGMLKKHHALELKQQAYDLLEHMGMQDRIGHRPAQLSGGERQRTAIARALINQPKILLADEPTGSLDQGTGEQVFSLLMGLQKQFNISCLLVTHNPALANLCDRIHGIEKRPESPTRERIGVDDV
ncbi:ABC transporter ATP-binding protein [Acanthopleuribacter pedis]|uniref:ABC transporter ATP-binding protein n=1 Tax=Acanthopleuribacter pedis TaxID=442870 RepID=A0A8J7Q9Z1_9BACT|nr:ABC transporter ATP-binding protein [Acanthopleuribacter pedis]MBO1320502.1 ABC transporter ATP-binding protein [Acanthopleuribacter pedis]